VRSTDAIVAATVVGVSVFVAPSHGLPSEETSGLRELASPAHLWLEGKVWSIAEGATTPPKRILLAAADPYFVDAEELEPAANERETSLYHVRLEGLRGTFRVSRRGDGADDLQWARVEQAKKYDLWTPQVRHFVDPRLNSLEALGAHSARFERSTTTTVATYSLSTGRRVFIFDQDGRLCEKRACRPRKNGSVLEGILWLKNYAQHPLFPRRFEHLRRDTATSSSELTTWQFERVEMVTNSLTLWQALPAELRKRTAPRTLP
jgi:hypothetical protein